MLWRWPCKVQNKYLSLQPREVFSRSGGRGRRGPDHHSWGWRQQLEHWGDCEEWVARKCDLNWQNFVSTMMKQIFQINPGGRVFSIKNSGDGTCAASYQGGFVMMGGFPGHGKVDRWGENSNIRVSISLSDTTRKATTSTLYPTFWKEECITPAPRSHLQKEKRSDSKKKILIPRACWSPEVSMVVNISQEPSCTCRQRSSGREEKIFPGILNPNLYHHHQRMIIICRCMQFCSLVDCLIVSCFGDFDRWFCQLCFITSTKDLFWNIWCLAHCAMVHRLLGKAL